MSSPSSGHHPNFATIFCVFYIGVIVADYDSRSNDYKIVNASNRHEVTGLKPMEEECFVKETRLIEESVADLLHYVKSMNFIS